MPSTTNNFSHITRTVGGESSRLPLYLRVATSLRSRISEGEWAPGNPLPRIQDLTEQYKIATITVRQALRLLSEAGLINISRGRGTFVNEDAGTATDFQNLRKAISDPMGDTPDLAIQILSRKHTKGLPAQLKVSHDEYDDYVRVHKIHLLNGEPFALLDVYIAAPIFARFPKGAEKQIRLSRLLRDYGDVDFISSRQEITLTYADHKTADLLKCTVMAALVRIRSWRIEAPNRVTYAGTFLYRGDRFIYDTEQKIGGDHFGFKVVPQLRKRNSLREK